MTETAAPARRYSTTLSHATGERKIHLGSEDLTEIMDLAFAAWDEVGADCSEKAGDKFEALIERIAELQRWTC